MEAYVSKLNNTGLHTKYGYDLGRKFYYIYLDYYTEFDVSIEQMLKTRKEGGFTDAWVRIMKEGYAPPVAEQKQVAMEVKQEIVQAPLVEEVRTEVGQGEVVSNKVEVTVDEDKRRKLNRKHHH
ncbi:MAG: hypothetical protein IPJ20_20100 [Flammeovirgaceae bacterium]|nr:hypothetical protein [Flammeovirgaceae bacterium]